MRFKIKKKTITNKNSKGFTLVEVLCAVVLLAIIATPIFQVIFTSLNLNLKSRKLLNASDLCSSTTEFISSKTLENYSYDTITTVKDDETGEDKEVKTPHPVSGYRDYYCGSGDENKYTNTTIDKLKLYNDDPAKAKIYVYEKYDEATKKFIQEGPSCTYDSLTPWNNVDPTEVSKIGPAKEYQYRTLKLTDINIDGFSYDMTIVTYIPTETYRVSYYCGVVFVNVYEAGKSNVLCSSKTSIANKY